MRLLRFCLSLFDVDLQTLQSLQNDYILFYSPWSYMIFSLYCFSRFFYVLFVAYPCFTVNLSTSPQVL